jgi:tetratricopeptide (TPR) repeat protein
MKARAVFFILLAAFACALNAQPEAGRWGDSEPARQYVRWAQNMINAGRWEEALEGLERANDYAGVSSDISYLLAAARLRNIYADMRYNRLNVIEALDRAIETNRWEYYDEGAALLMKAEQLIVMRRFSNALSILDQTEKNVYLPGAASSGAGRAADIAHLRLLAFRGVSAGAGYEAVQGLARFRSLVLLSMDRYPEDPRPLRVFFEYARNRMPAVSGAASELAESDINLLELAMRRLPFLLETEPDLAWLASPLMRDTDAARRLVSSYRAGGLSGGEEFRPAAGSIAAALNLGLIGDMEAVEELFGVFADNENPVLNKKTIDDIYALLRGEEGRDLFTRKLLSFSGEIISDDDSDGYIESRVFYNSGFMSEYRYDRNQSGIADLLISFDADGTPRRVLFSDAERPFTLYLEWERYPSVLICRLSDETFLFRPADFQFAPLTFPELGGSQRYRGPFFPLLSHYDITRRTLVSFCVTLSRPSPEFDGAVETIYLERGIPLRSVETLDDKQVSVTEFERGSPVIQYLDMDMDGRMETIRRFYPPPPDFPENFNIRKLLASSESDWTGDGRHKTGEVYRQDGSVVYTWDMDGSGIMNYYYQTESGINNRE